MVGLFWVSEDAVHLGAPPGEVELSHQVLDRFVAGTLSPAVLSARGRAHGAAKTPRPAEREALLQQWAQS